MEAPWKYETKISQAIEAHMSSRAKEREWRVWGFKREEYSLREDG